MKYLEFQLRKPRGAVEPSSMGARYSGAGVKYEPRSGNRESIFQVYVESLPGYSPFKVITCTSLQYEQVWSEKRPHLTWYAACFSFCGVARYLSHFLWNLDTFSAPLYASLTFLALRMNWGPKRI